MIGSGVVEVHRHLDEPLSEYLGVEVHVLLRIARQGRDMMQPSHRPPPPFQCRCFAPSTSSPHLLRARRGTLRVFPARSTETNSPKKGERPAAFPDALPFEPGRSA